MPIIVIALNCVAITDRPDRPPRQAAAAEKVAFELVAPLRQAQAVPDHPDEVDADDCPVDGCISQCSAGSTGPGLHQEKILLEQIEAAEHE